jgi:uroporphyrinogen decarboxylase
MDHLQRFLNNMEYTPADRVPNWEAGVWPQTAARWEAEGLPPGSLHWNWFYGEGSLGMDPREFIWFTANMIPPFDYEVLAEDDAHVTFRDEKGIVRRALKEGSIGRARMSMDEYIGFPVADAADWEAIKRRYWACSPQRYEPNWEALRVEGWRSRRHPLIFGPNCSTLGFYWIARELLGTEGLSYAWYDQPGLLHDIMDFWADFLIDAARPILAHTTLDYVCLNEDLAMKTGPLLSPQTFRTFIYPRLCKVIEFLKGHGTRYICVDTDGNPEVLVPMLLDAGVDALWPLERAANQDPLRLRRKFGRSLRLWGGVDKRELAKGREAIDRHLLALQPLIEEGGFIPTVDHTVSPDVSWDNFQYYLERKQLLLAAAL